MRSFSRDNFAFLKKDLKKIKHSIIIYSVNRIFAGVAQWQSSSFVMSRLQVRFPSPAPENKTSLSFGKGVLFSTESVFADGINPTTVG